jgi:CRP-like cAMP-binding protein
VESNAGASDLPEVLEAGDPLGDVAAFEGGPYPASGTALERTECLVIPRAELFRLLEQNPTLARAFVHGLTQRIVQLTKELRRKP